MKNALLLTLLFLAICASAQQTLSTYIGASAYTSDTIWHTLTGANQTSRLTLGYGKNVDCQPFESFSDWEVKSKGVSTCNHSWQYAEYEDVNAETGITNAVYCPCGCTWHENQARICAKCFRHELRVITRGYNQVPKPLSDYKKLLGKIKQ
jgi:hypothetical protein